MGGKATWDWLICAVNFTEVAPANPRHIAFTIALFPVPALAKSLKLLACLRGNFELYGELMSSNHESMPTA